MHALDFLRIELHGRTVGFLVSLSQGQNRLYFSPDYIYDKQRATFSLTTHPSFPNHDKLLSEPWIRWQRLHPVLSNLLPEGALRQKLAQSLKVHIDHEFLLLKHLGQDLPGALVVSPVSVDNVPSFILTHLGTNTKILKTTIAKPVLTNQTQQSSRYFSLAGVQTKFSMCQILTQIGERFTLPISLPELGDWIVKPPSSAHPFVPENEYSMMRLAQIAGVYIPEIKLIPTNTLIGVSDDSDGLAYAIKRFDRQTLVNGDIGRIHSEDFAQILIKYPHEKYDGGNYAQIAKILYRFSKNGLADVNQFARRLLVNILLANGDAHLKNWSVVYQDGINPILSPAYDIVSTKAYLPHEREIALNLDSTKDWHKINMADFEHWAKKADIPWRSVKPHLVDVIQIARETWQIAFDCLPMNEIHKQLLKKHWASLHDDFKIG